MITAKEVRDRLRVDSASVRDGVVTIRRGFFYTHGRTANHLVEEVRAAFPNAEILDSGEVWKSFNGGAPVARQSHWFVKFREGQS